MRILILLFLAAPLVEIYFFVQVGSALGAGMTVFLVVFTAVLGLYLVRQQGFATFMKMQVTMQKGESPAMEMMEGVALFLAGTFLLIPGFFTDAVGFVLLIPPCRQHLIYTFVARLSNVNASRRYRNTGSSKHRVIESKHKDSG